MVKWLLLFAVSVVIFSACDSQEKKESDVQERLSREFPYQAKSWVLIKCFEISPYSASMPQFFYEREMGDLRSAKNKKKAIDEYRLVQLLGKSELEIGGMYDELLEHRLERNGKFVYLNMRGTNQEEAVYLLYAIIKSYEDALEEQEHERLRRAVILIKKKCAEILDKENECHTKAKALAKELGIPTEKLDETDFDERSKGQVSGDLMKLKKLRSEWQHEKERREEMQENLLFIEEKDTSAIEPMKFLKAGWTDEVALEMEALRKR